jgi:hypothetical protein
MIIRSQDKKKIATFDKCMDFSPIQTNADKIRSMDDEEMAEFINGIDRYDDYAILINGDTVIDMTSCILEWLQSEAE